MKQMVFNRNGIAIALWIRLKYSTEITSIFSSIWNMTTSLLTTFRRTTTIVCLNFISSWQQWVDSIEFGRIRPTPDAQCTILCRVNPAPAISFIWDHDHFRTLFSYVTHFSFFTINLFKNDLMEIPFIKFFAINSHGTQIWIMLS